MAGASGALVIAGATGSLRMTGADGSIAKRSPGGAMSPEHPAANSAVVSASPALESRQWRYLDTRDNMAYSGDTQN
jgi:hypothetical protein